MLAPIHLRDPVQDSSLLYLCVNGERIFKSVEVLATAIYEKAGYSGPSSLSGIIPRALAFDNPKTTAIGIQCRGPILEFVRERMEALLPEAVGPVEDLIALRLTRAGEIDVRKRLIAINEPLLQAQMAGPAVDGPHELVDPESRTDSAGCPPSAGHQESTQTFPFDLEKEGARGEVPEALARLSTTESQSIGEDDKIKGEPSSGQIDEDRVTNYHSKGHPKEANPDEIKRHVSSSLDLSSGQNESESGIPAPMPPPVEGDPIGPDNDDQRQPLVRRLLRSYRFWVAVAMVFFITVTAYHDRKYIESLLDFDKDKPVILVCLLPGKTDFEQSFNDEVQSYIDKIVSRDTCRYRVRFEERPKQITLLDDAKDAVLDENAKGIVWFEYSQLGEEKKVSCSKFDLQGYYGNHSLIVKPKENDHSVTDYFGVSSIGYLTEVAASSYEASNRISDAISVINDGLQVEPGIVEYPELIEQIGRLGLRLGEYSSAAETLLMAKHRLDKQPKKVPDHMQPERDLIIREATEALVRGARFEDAFALFPLKGSGGLESADVSTGDGFLFSKQGLALVRLEYLPGIVALIMPNKDTMIIAEVVNPPLNLYGQIVPNESAVVIKGSPLDNLLYLTKARPGKGVFQIDWNSAVHSETEPNVHYKKVRDMLHVSKQAE